MLLLRQLLKLKVANESCSIYILGLCSCFYCTISIPPQNNFSQILFEIKPSYPKDRILSITNNYQNVANRNNILSVFLEQYVMGETAIA